MTAFIYLSAIADEASGWLVRFVHPLSAYFKVASFLLLEISLAAILVVVALSLVRARKQMSAFAPGHPD